MRGHRGWIVVGFVAACGSSYGANVDEQRDASAPDGVAPSVTDAGDAAPDAPSIPECGAQRTVLVSAGNGALSRFTLLWPVPYIIEHPNAAYAYDDTSNAPAVVTGSTTHPLYERKLGSGSFLDGTGRNPHPTAFVTGTNESHSSMPRGLVQSDVLEIISAGALAQQTALGPPIPAFGIGYQFTYGPSSNAPAIQTAGDATTAVNAIATAANLSEADKAMLTPDESIVAAWAGADAVPKYTTLARNLLLGANAFRMGLVGTMAMPALLDDPHGAWSNGDAITGADTLATILRSFYAELAKHPEPKCGHKGGPLALSDNVVMVLVGDTPKTSFSRSPWEDGTLGNANFIYVRANGWLWPGWFGALDPGVGRQNFDPVTGALSASTEALTSTHAAQTGILYAITRGNTVFTAALSSYPYAGTVASPPP